MLFEHIAICIAQLPEESRGSLDVGKEERDTA
jgi:hypothetical protein